MTTLPDRLADNVGAVRRRWRRSPRVATMGDLHRLQWGWWLVFVAIAIVNLGVMSDNASVAWPRGLGAGGAGFFAGITDIGRSGWILILTGLLAIAVACADWIVVMRRIRVAWAEVGVLAGYVFFCVGVGAIVTNVLKQLIGRARPVGYDDVGALSLDPFNFDYANASFPSGHATTVGAMTLALMLILPRIAWPVFGLGLLVAFSRVMVGAHYPSDVVAGLAVGMTVAYLAARVLAKRGYGFGFDRAGQLRARTGGVRRVLRRPGGISAMASGLWAALVGRVPSAAPPGPAPAPDRQ